MDIKIYFYYTDSIQRWSSNIAKIKHRNLHTSRGQFVSNTQIRTSKDELNWLILLSSAVGYNTWNKWVCNHNEYKRKKARKKLWWKKSQKGPMTVIAVGALRACCLLLYSLWLQSCQGLRGCRLPTRTLQHCDEDGVQVSRRGHKSEVGKHNNIKQNPRAGWTGGGRETSGKVDWHPLMPLVGWSQKSCRGIKGARG